MGGAHAGSPDAGTVYRTYAPAPRARAEGAVPPPLGSMLRIVMSLEKGLLTDVQGALTCKQIRLASCVFLRCQRTKLD